MALLRGSDNHVIGGVDAIAEGSVAIAISQGGAVKRYEHTDPNEDVAAFATGAFGRLLVVADGHSGEDAAEIAVTETLRQVADRLSGSQAAIVAGWNARAAAILADAQRAILAGVARGARDTARTTLSIALVCPDAASLCYASIGDSHIFRIGPLEAVDVGVAPDPHGDFLGRPESPPQSVCELAVIGVETLDGTRAVVLATDGLSERRIGVDLPEATVLECINEQERQTDSLRPLETARWIAEAALAAHRRHRAGDNIATATWWP
jgi:serine/threonine protein phosphatase PrpC